MRRIFTLLLAILITLQSSAQKIDSIRKATPPPRKEGLTDLPSKITKVVLADDNTILDLLIKDAIEKGWYISPFEFSTREGFEVEKSDSNFFFIVRVKALHRKESEPAMEFISLIKGSPKVKGDMEEMPEILRLPLCPVNDTDGKIFSFLPAYVSIFQNHIQSIIDRNANAYLGMMMYKDRINDVECERILFTEDDFVFDLSQEKLNEDFGGKAEMVSLDTVEDAMAEGLEGTIVPLVLAPEKIQKGSYCYKMLITADTHELVYFRKHKLTKRKGVGFLKYDYQIISAPFRHSK